jgi:hypothetical protein
MLAGIGRLARVELVDGGVLIRRSEGHLFGIREFSIADVVGRNYIITCCV